MQNERFIFTIHANKRFDERFISLSKKDEVNSVISCDKSEVYKLRNSNAYKNTKASKKPKIFHFKSKNEMYLICERKLQKNGSYAQVVITVIDLNNDEEKQSLITEEFEKEMYLYEEVLKEADKLSHVDKDRLAKKEKKDKKKLLKKAKKTKSVKKKVKVEPLTFEETLLKKILNISKIGFFNYITLSFYHIEDDFLDLYDNQLNLIIKINSSTDSIISLYRKLDKMKLNFHSNSTSQYNKIIKDIVNKKDVMRQQSAKYIKLVKNIKSDNCLYNLNDGYQKLVLKMNNINKKETPDFILQSEIQLKEKIEKLKLVPLFREVDFDTSVLNKAGLKSANDWFSKLLKMLALIDCKKNNLDKLEITHENNTLYRRQIIGLIKKDLKTIMVLFNKKIDFELKEMKNIKKPYQKLLIQVMPLIIKSLKTIYGASGSFSSESYNEIFNLFCDIKDCKLDKEEEKTLEEYFEFLLPYQTKMELIKIKQNDFVLKKSLVSSNMSDLNIMKDFVKEKNNETYDKIENIIIFYKVVYDKMTELEYDSFYLVDYL
jgi:hypothetical protein